MGKEQNRINKVFTKDQIEALDAALKQLEDLTADLPVLSGDDKAGLVKPPDGAGDWMQGMLTRSQQNLDKLSRSYDPALVQNDLNLIEVIEQRQLRLQRINDRLTGGSFLAGSDAFAVLLGVRRQLKDAGVAGVDDNLSEGLSRFFSRTAHADAATPAK